MNKLIFLIVSCFISTIASAQITPTYEWIKPDTSHMEDVCFSNNYLYSIGTKLTKWDTLGNKIWENDQIFGHKIALDQNNNLVVLSTLPSTGAVIGSTTISSAGGTDILLLKVDTAGNMIWANHYGNALDDYANEFCTDYNNDIYVNCRIDSGYYNAINKYSGNGGSLIWSKSLIDSNANLYSLRHIQYSLVDSSIVISGLFKFSLTVDGQHVVTIPHASFGHATDLYVLKLKTVNGTTVFLKNITQTQRGEYNNSELYVNPFNGHIIVNGSTLTLSGDHIFLYEYDSNSDSLMGTIESVSAYTNGFSNFSSNGNVRSYRDNASQDIMKMKNAFNIPLIQFNFSPKYPRKAFIYGLNSIYVPLFYIDSNISTTVSQYGFSKIGLPPCALNATYNTLTVDLCFSQLPYIFNNQVLTTSGIYYDTLVNSNACDSVIMLNLTIDTINTSVTQNSLTILTANASGANYQWLMCNPFTILAGETNQNFVASTPGDYAVIVSQNGCSDTSNCIPILFPMHMDETSVNNTCVVYPNPARTTLYINTSSSLKTTKKELFNAIGQLIYSTTKNEIDISGFAEGIYYLKCMGVCKKVIIK